MWWPGHWGTDEVGFKSLNSSFSRIDMVVMWFDEHVVAPFVGEIFFDECTCLVVHYV